MKHCTSCGKDKPVEEFNRSSRSSDGRQRWCRSCSKDAYQSNRGRHLQNVQKRKFKNIAECRDYIIAVFSSGCIDCGITDSRVLEFDHVRGKKRAGVASLIRDGYSLAVVKREVAKCEVRCKNCHAIATFSRLGTTWHEAYLGL